jgi:peptidoglycan hydrolase-like protein with peptidoglycan-binding domain
MTRRSITRVAALAGVVSLAWTAPVAAQAARESAERSYDAVKSMLLMYPQESVREAQQALVAQGYDPGRTDGRLDSRTEDAIAKFQRDHGMPPDGRLSPATIAALKGGPAAASPR